MLIPIRCWTCNNPWLSNRYPSILKRKDEYCREEGKSTTEMEYLTPTTVKTAWGKALDDFKITKQCCRRHVLSHIDLF
jgi:DNA-directed RNA polymerase I, II, and III subunit RPABC5